VLVCAAKKMLPNCRLVLSGVLRRRDVSWRRVAALNVRFDWVANALGLTFVNPNSWIEDGDFARDGLNLDGRGKRRPDSCMLQLVDWMLGDRQRARCDKI
jgi:hypothetical protein